MCRMIFASYEIFWSLRSEHEFFLNGQLSLSPVALGVGLPSELTSALMATLRFQFGGKCTVLL